MCISYGSELNFCSSDIKIFDGSLTHISKINYVSKCVGGIKIRQGYSDSALNFASNGMCGYRIYIDFPDFNRKNENCVGVTEEISEINARLM